jgi:hypothetical protein
MSSGVFRPARSALKGWPWGFSLAAPVSATGDREMVLAGNMRRVR